MKRAYTLAAALAILAPAAMAADLNASNQSTSQSGSASSIHRGGDTVNAATAIAPSGNNTAPCVLHPSFGIAESVGLSVGAPRVDHDCNMKGESNTLAVIGNMPPSKGRNLAISHLCSNVPTMRQTLIAQGECSMAEPAPKARSVSTRSTVTAPQPTVAYTKCHITPDGKIGVAAPKGGNMDLAISQCRTALAQ